MASTNSICFLQCACTDQLVLKSTMDRADGSPRGSESGISHSDGTRALPNHGTHSRPLCAGPPVLKVGNDFMREKFADTCNMVAYARTPKGAAHSCLPVAWFRVHARPYIAHTQHLHVRGGRCWPKRIASTTWCAKRSVAIPVLIISDVGLRHNIVCSDMRMQTLDSPSRHRATHAPMHAGDPRAAEPRAVLPRCVRAVPHGAELETHYQGQTMRTN